VFLVIGARKANILARVMEQRERQDADLPAALVIPANGALHWFVDRAAAALLRPQTKEL
jgi:6-phosphogluconolactonase